MSRIGRKPVEIPEGIEIKIEAEKIVVKGAKGVLEKKLDSDIQVAFEGKTLKVERTTEEPRVRALHGLYRMQIYNMIQGVKTGWEKSLELTGVGFRAIKEGSKLILYLGYSHPLEILPPAGIDFAVEGTSKIKVLGIDKELVGQIAAKIRKLREIEPYKGKGIKYRGEIVRRKAGKVVKTAAGGA